jgi:hypothetical protein
MKVTAAPSRRNTNNERLFLFTARAAAPRSLRGRSVVLCCADLLTRSAGPVGELRMRSSVQAVGLGLLLLTYSLGSPA